MNDENQIANILYRYAALIDMGRLEEAAALFAHARIKVHPGDAQDDGTIDGRQLLELWRKKIILYEDGTPRTKHLVTNPIIEIDPNGRTATAKSYYTVVQTIFTLPPQIIVMGRYDDRFVKENADWHIAYRDYTLIDAAGDLRGHIRGSLLDNQSVDPEL
ncbi:MAG TPA: nuclear transport factor 2 family protein [Rhizorhapis sp.]